MKKNKLNWRTTQTTDDKMLYLTIMRDVKAYCAKGFCELSIALINFCELPQSLIIRDIRLMNLSAFDQHLIVYWSNYNSVHIFFRRFISILCKVNNEPLLSRAFNEAIFEFTQDIRIRNNNG